MMRSVGARLQVPVLSCNGPQSRAPPPGLRLPKSASILARPTHRQVAARAGPTRQAEQAAEKTKEVSKGILSDLGAARQRLLDNGISPGDIATSCGIVGVTLGTAFQVCHNVGYLPVYDVLPFQVAGLPYAGTIPIVLAPIWLLYGYAAPIVDEYLAGSGSEVGREEINRARLRGKELSSVLLCWAALAAHFLLSDWLYLNGQPHLLHHAILAPLVLAIWKKFDGTTGGLVLGSLLTVGAPVGEMIIVNFLGLWHYERPDLGGVPTWAGWCYFGYAIGVAMVARYIASRKDGNA